MHSKSKSDALATGRIQLDLTPHVCQARMWQAIARRLAIETLLLLQLLVHMTRNCLERYRRKTLVHTRQTASAEHYMPCFGYQEMYTLHRSVRAPRRHRGAPELGHRLLAHFSWSFSSSSAGRFYLTATSHTCLDVGDGASCSSASFTWWQIAPVRQRCIRSWC